MTTYRGEWQIGDVVAFRDSHWRVKGIDRAASQTGAAILTLEDVVTEHEIAVSASRVSLRQRTYTRDAEETRTAIPCSYVSDAVMGTLCGESSRFVIATGEGLDARTLYRCTDHVSLTVAAVINRHLEFTVNFAPGEEWK